ncbi:hydroxyacylglutathione hydrolase-like protein isoform X5 [Cebus imitator]|uniref:hydroxyacylglutathione hydrolase-like protein isoform X5 n=1 Tax=Cebus imitator TaxID=2715852 RepID=UPI00080A7028|nr:hydroxyacylglutathione hydrolase-like protein isoform X5 [Cebus imitator]
MKVKVIPVLEDNYMYLVIEELTREAVAVDVAVPKRGPRAGKPGAGAAASRTGGAGRGRAHLLADAQAGARRGAAVWGHPRALPPDARPHLRPHELLPVGGRLPGPPRPVLGGRAVGGRLRLVLGGQRPADVPEPGRAGHPAPRDEGVLRPRAHAQQPGVCAESGALQRPRPVVTPEEGRGRCAHGALDSGRGAPLQPLPAGGRGARAQVHGQGGPRRRPGGTLQGAGTLRTGRRAAAATGTGPPCAAVGAPECSPQQVSVPPDPHRAGSHIPLRDLSQLDSRKGHLWKLLRGSGLPAAQSQRVDVHDHSVGPVWAWRPGCLGSGVHGASES